MPMPKAIVATMTCREEDSMILKQPDKAVSSVSPMKVESDADLMVLYAA
jgi:hypothetical protein